MEKGLLEAEKKHLLLMLKEAKEEVKATGVKLEDNVEVEGGDL